MGRSPCCEKQHVNKGAWTKEEDERLINYIKFHGEGCWRSLPKAAGLQRCGKSCRLRWINYLRPDLKRGNFTDEEDELIINLHSLLGNKWSLIATRLSGRTDNEIKNYWNTHIKRKLINRGIDPQTHRPLNPSSTKITDTTTTTTKTNNLTSKSVDHNNMKDTFQLINMQGSTLQFSMASRLNITTKNDSNSISPTNRASNFSQDSSTVSSIITSEEGYGDEINLELCISLPTSSKISTNKIYGKQEEITYYQTFSTTPIYANVY